MPGDTSAPRGPQWPGLASQTVKPETAQPCTQRLSAPWLHYYATRALPCPPLRRQSLHQVRLEGCMPWALALFLLLLSPLSSFSAHSLPPPFCLPLLFHTFLSSTLFLLPNRTPFSPCPFPHVSHLSLFFLCSLSLSATSACGGFTRKLLKGFSTSC